MMPGPKPLEPKEFAARHAEALNYILVSIIAPRKFEVKCRACGLNRLISTFRVKGASCICTHKRKHYRVKYTLETYNAHIHSKGYSEYECLELGSMSKSKCSYKHSCGHKFLMTRGCFIGSKEPCVKCRNYGYTNDEYLKIMRKHSKVLVPLDLYLQSKDCVNGLRHRYVKCGHVVRLHPGRFTRGRDAPLCKVCSPNRVWHKFRADGVRFQTRSRVELEFVRFLVRDKHIDPNRIEYEPTSSRIEYLNPVKGKAAFYVPDFKVGNVHFEIKDLASLGLRYYHWKPQDEALIENRAKVKAAEKAFDDYRVYVYIKGKFYRTRKFWTTPEQTRLLSI